MDRRKNDAVPFYRECQWDTGLYLELPKLGPIYRIQFPIEFRFDSLYLVVNTCIRVYACMDSTFFQSAFKGVMLLGGIGEDGMVYGVNPEQAANMELSVSNPSLDKVTIGIYTFPRLF